MGVCSVLPDWSSRSSSFDCIVRYCDFLEQIHLVVVLSFAVIRSR